ncbi:MAG: 4Fe-4S dicluster domain-containing protein [Candidatus Scalindua sp.]|nr:4Fe-4S dicluster domain-containing protein [Candidatus Scalindua sp.]
MTEHRNINSMKGSINYKIRLVVQVLVFAAFISLLVFADPIAEKDGAVDIFLRMSPLSAIGAMVAAKEFIVRYWPAFIVLAASLFLGRFFCGWVCPLGTTLDITDGLLKRQRKRISYRIYDGKRLKYYILAFLLLSLFIGHQMVGWLDPLSIVTNAYSIVVHPYLVSLLNSFFGFFHKFYFISFVSDPVHGFLKEALFALHPPFFRGHFIFLLLFSVIILLGLFYKRYWCRDLCPLGALFALLSGWSIFKRVVGENICDSCDKCNVNCKMGAIDDTGKKTQAGECILCMKCQDICPTGAIRFTLNQPQEQDVPVNLTKRGFVTACVSSAVVAPLLSLNFQKKKNKGDLGIIRPPGSIPEDKFQAKCIRCGECMRVCKTNGLHPTILEAGLSGMWTPQLIPRIGYCAHDCVLCTKVCPSGAITRLSKEKKQRLAIGKAKIDRNRCIPWVGYARLPDLDKNWEDVSCGVCEEVCPVPTKAIHFNTYVHGNGKEIRRVYVREESCIGCGFCEKVCPVNGRSAIVVEGIQPQVMTKEISMLEKDFFPDSIEQWKRKERTRVYAGKDKLFEYINGGAEVYLSYTFIQVSTATYINKGTDNSVKVNIWEFGSSDDAYGVFTKDRAGQDINIGSEAALYDNYLWVWKGKYFISFEPYGGNISPDDVAFIGTSIVGSISAGKVRLPAVLSYLPEGGYVRGSSRFFHKKIILDNLYISDKFIDKNVFNLSEQTDAVVADYKSAKSGSSFKMLIVEYTNKQVALEPLNNFVELRKSWGENGLKTGSVHTFEDLKGRFSSIACIDNTIIATFFVETREKSELHINATVSKVKAFQGKD